ncbi:AIR12 precursor [Iris pallida]|uniref:AIR12 n=1 Tax=Iris pallida TaxID=29817 RepID=A0AAX6HCB3_IRIPA|nr:AIR12 precursor [Iris pallida]
MSSPNPNPRSIRVQSVVNNGRQWHIPLLALVFAAPAHSNGWLAWDVNPAPDDGMIDSQSLIAFCDPSSGGIDFITYNITGYGPVKEGPIDLHVSNVAGEYVGSEMRIFAKVKFPRGTTKVKRYYRWRGAWWTRCQPSTRSARTTWLPRACSIC